MTFLTCDQKVWEDEEESENYIYSTFRFAKVRNGEPLWVEPKHCDDTIIYARIGEDNAKI